VICTGGARDSALQFFCCYDRRLLRYVVHSFFSGFFGPDFSSLFWFFFGLFLAGGLGMGEFFDPPIRLLIAA